MNDINAYADNNPLAFFAFFVCSLFIFLYFLSRLGWNAIAQKYKTQFLPSGKKYSSVRAKIGFVEYNYIKMHIAENGIHLKMPLLLRAFHPPLFLPWKEIEILFDNERTQAMQESLWMFAGIIEIIPGGKSLFLWHTKNSTVLRIGKTFPINVIIHRHIELPQSLKNSYNGKKAVSVS